MPRESRDANRLLTELEVAKNDFSPGHAARVAKLLGELAEIAIDDSRELIRYHECLLFLRAFPHAAEQVPSVENQLNNFCERIASLEAADLSVFDDFDTSGIAGTTMQDTLSFDVARWLAARIPRNVEIAWNDYWEDYGGERARGTTWPRFIPLLEEDADVEANIPWEQWLDAARGREKALPWLLAGFERLALSGRRRAELYDSLRLPVRWRLENLKLSRTRNWNRPRKVYFHEGALIQRSEVSLEQELARPAPELEKLSAADGERVMQHIREIMVVRYRELYGTTLGDGNWVVRADLGRGVVMHFWGLAPERRLPLRGYLAGYTMKNGVPINYIEAIGLCEWIEVGFNTFYTYRQGETAWIYAQALRCLCALTKARCISIYPYQIGQNNEEAIDSGAFWFYRKLEFRPGRADLRELCEKEEKRIAADRTYRTSARTLRRLAEAHMFYEIGEGETSVGSTPSNAAGDWDRFSMRNVGVLVNRRMAREFWGEIERLRRASMAAVVRALKIKIEGWTREQKKALENWSLVLGLIPELRSWTADEKSKLIKIIRAKAAANEMEYWRETLKHGRLRAELLRLGSKAEA